ncbi:MAG TPA: hypothetical protein VF458_08060 [Ktedonobacteraceae bacterium]
MCTRRSRPVHLLFLSVLLGAASLFAWLWLVLFPFCFFFADHLAALYRPPLLVIVLSNLALLGGLATGGLWFRQVWAFRLGLTLVICALALDLLWLVLSFSWDLFELGPALLLALNGVLLSLFLEPAVARAMVVKQHDR